MNPDLNPEKLEEKVVLPEEIEIQNLDHLGIVAGLIDEIGIVEIINEKLGKDSREKISSGQVVKALILNGLGMVSRPLYLFSQFFADKATEKLLGTGIKSEYLNDDKIGRVMDELYQLGLTNLFTELALVVLKKFQIETKYAHLDSTSFHLHGEYKTTEKPEAEKVSLKERPILIPKGYSRDPRPDLKQCVLDLMVSNDSSMPLFMRAGDGNEADKAVFGKIIMEVKKQINLDSIMVSDSALYSQENLQLMKGVNWITRVPMTLKKAKEIVQTGEIQSLKELGNLEEPEREKIKELQEKGYKWQEQIVTYAGIQQRWLIVESEQRRKSDWEKLDRKIEQEKKKAEKLLKQLEKEEFEAPSHAQYSLKGINKKLKFWGLQEIKLVEVSLKNQKKRYKVQGEIQEKMPEVEKKRQEAGRFILATNVLNQKEMSAAEILKAYKNQQGCERGFGFLKDPLFFADSFFVEKAERVETLLFLMTLSLLVYNLGQRELRKSLKRAKSGVKNQVGKPTDNPTLRWIFQSFQGIHLLTLNGLQKVVNLTEERRFILEFLPASCQKYYL